MFLSRIIFLKFNSSATFSIRVSQNGALVPSPCVSLLCKGVVIVRLISYRTKSY